jgi:hypothetical protein
MATETHLVTELERLNVRAEGPATAGIWLVTDGSEFPMIGWSDFIVVVLGWWAASMLRLLRNDSGRERVHFMDGPYAVEISRPTTGRLYLQMFAGPSGGCEVATGEADLKRFVSELSSQSRKLLCACKSHGWWSKDADELTLHVQELDRELALRGTS